MAKVATQSKDKVNMLQLVCFKLADEEYAIDIVNVQEVIRVQKITPVPQMPDFVLGVINIRGNVLPVFDLRSKFSLKLTEFNPKTKILVVSKGADTMSFIVDEILDNIKVDETLLDPAPNVKTGIKKDCIKGLVLLDGRVVTVLDIERMSSDILKDLGVEKE